MHTGVPPQATGGNAASGCSNIGANRKKILMLVKSIIDIVFSMVNLGYSGIQVNICSAYNIVDDFLCPESAIDIDEQVSRFCYLDSIAERHAMRGLAIMVDQATPRPYAVRPHDLFETPSAFPLLEGHGVAV